MTTYTDEYGEVYDTSHPMIGATVYRVLASGKPSRTTYTVIGMYPDTVARIVQDSGNGCIRAVPLAELVVSA